MQSQDKIAPELSTLLSSVRNRVRRFVLVDSLLAIIGLVTGVFWLGFLIDQTPVRFGGTEMPRLARILFFSTGIGCLAWLTGKLLIGRLLRPLPDASLALLIERLYPELGGRLTTAVELLGSERKIDDHSQSLLAKVHQQAATLVAKVEPSRLFRRETLIRKGFLAGPLSVATVAFLVFDPSSFALAAKRLTLLSDAPWPRRADIEMVGIELPTITASDDDSDQTELIPFDQKLVRLPIGSSSSLRLRANAIDAELPSVCTVYYETDSGSTGQSNMRRVGRVVDGYQHFVLDGPPLTDLSESVVLSVRGLDDRLDDYRIQAVVPPSISAATVAVKFPAYLKSSEPDQTDWNRDYQTGIRVEEGSDVEVQIISTTPLGSIDLWIQGGSNREGILGSTPQQTEPDPLDSDQINTAVQSESSVHSDSLSLESMRISEDGLTATLTLPKLMSPTTISIVPRDVDNISAQSPYRYLIGVIKDEPPEIKLGLQGIGTAVTANAKIPIQSRIQDDYGAYRSAITLVLQDEATENKVVQGTPDLEVESQPNQLLSETNLDIPDGSGATETDADLRELVAQKQLPEIAPGMRIDIIGETSDRYDLGIDHTTRTEVIRLPIVTPETLLAFLERRELSLRARLEQTLDESRTLRDNLSEFAAPPTNAPLTDEPRSNANAEGSVTLDQPDRETQVRRLRIQQARLQSEKTREELAGIATSIDDILLEMQNNRVDSVDRQNRLGTGVRDPIQNVISGTLQELQQQVAKLDNSAANQSLLADESRIAVAQCEQLILDLTAILDKMLDLESYNEILDLVRGLIEDQNELMEDTKSERKKKVLDLFK